jgi:hypothetical protein
MSHQTGEFYVLPLHFTGINMQPPLAIKRMEDNPMSDRPQDVIWNPMTTKLADFGLHIVNDSAADPLIQQARDRYKLPLALDDLPPNARQGLQEWFAELTSAELKEKADKK